MQRIVPLALMLLFFPPVYIVLRYLRWCCKEDQRENQRDEDFDLEVE